MNPTPPTQRPPTQPPTATDPVIGRPARAWVGRRPDVSTPAADDSFDALTDLFMGEASPSRGAASRVGPAATGDQGHTVPAASLAAARPVLRLAGGGEDEVAAVAPVPTSPSTTGPTPSRVQIDRDLGEPIVECLSLSNLPVLASAWASQYVREIAAAAGRPVAVLRVQAGFASVELIGDWAGDAGKLSVEPVEDLGVALRIAAATTDRWIIRCSTPEQRDLAGHGLVRVLTVLTGADEAAAAAAMQAVETVGPGLAETGGPVLRLAVMGVVDEASISAGRALAAAAESRLGRPVQQVVCSSKIRSARAPVSVFSGPVGQELPAIIELLEVVLGVESVRATPTMSMSPNDAALGGTAAGRRVDAPLVRDEPAAPATVEPPPSRRADPVWESELPTIASDPLPADGLDDVPLPESIMPSAAIAPATVGPVVEIEATSGSGTASLMPWLGEAAPSTQAFAEPILAADAPPATAAQAPWTPAPATAPAAAEPLVPPERPRATAESSGLWSFVPGLSGTPIRCPYAEGVEFGMDDSGALHLLARAASTSSQDSALADLLVAASWASAHAALLGARSHGQRPVMHVFTDQPKRSRRLLDTDVRVHVLAPVSVGAQTAWYCAELN